MTRFSLILVMGRSLLISSLSNWFKKTSEAKETAEEPVDIFDKESHCQDSLERCKEQHIGSYESNVRLCEGDWAPTAVAGKMLGGSASPGELYNACRQEFEDTKNKGVSSCERSYAKCMDQ